jgi:hypothetical protein
MGKLEFMYMQKNMLMNAKLFLKHLELVSRNMVGGV